MKSRLRISVSGGCPKGCRACSAKRTRATVSSAMWVEREADFKASLEQGVFDLILADLYPPLLRRAVRIEDRPATLAASAIRSWGRYLLRWGCVISSKTRCRWRSSFKAAES